MECFYFCFCSCFCWGRRCCPCTDGGGESCLFGADDPSTTTERDFSPSRPRRRTRSRCCAPPAPSRPSTTRPRRAGRTYALTRATRCSTRSTASRTRRAWRRATGRWGGRAGGTRAWRRVRRSGRRGGRCARILCWGMRSLAGRSC